MYLKDNTVNDIINMFPERPIQVFETSGLNYGMILKFRKGYFKLYPSAPAGNYRVQRYYYHSIKPISDDLVSIYDMKKYLNNLQ